MPSGAASRNDAETARQRQVTYRSREGLHGACRPSLCDGPSWRFASLGKDAPHFTVKVPAAKTFPAASTTSTFHSPGTTFFRLQ